MYVCHECIYCCFVHLLLTFYCCRTDCGFSDPDQGNPQFGLVKASNCSCIMTVATQRKCDAHQKSCACELHPVNQTFSIQSGYVALRTLSETLHGYSFGRRLTLAGSLPTEFIVEMHKTGAARRLAVWTSRNNTVAHRLWHPSSSVACFHVISAIGCQLPDACTDKTGTLMLNLSNTPVYIASTSDYVGSLTWIKPCASGRSLGCAPATQACPKMSNCSSCRRGSCIDPSNCCLTCSVGFEFIPSTLTADCTGQCLRPADAGCTPDTFPSTSNCSFYTGAHCATCKSPADTAWPCPASDRTCCLTCPIGYTHTMIRGSNTDCTGTCTRAGHSAAASTLPRAPGIELWRQAPRASPHQRSVASASQAMSLDSTGYASFFLTLVVGVPAHNAVGPTLLVFTEVPLLRLPLTLLAFPITSAGILGVLR